MNAALAFVAGLVFGIGLIVAGMANPAKVLAFLDLFGRWDPSLAIVMASAIPVSAIGYALARRRGTTLRGAALTLPTARDIDRPLVIGALVFGIGWGLAGICPGPALVLVGGGFLQGFVFVGAMLAGMLAFDFVKRARAAPEPARSDA
jgi:uncharacterized membrane protein YedE/YeeE